MEPLFGSPYWTTEVRLICRYDAPGDLWKVEDGDEILGVGRQTYYWDSLVTKPS